MKLLIWLAAIALAVVWLVRSKKQSTQSAMRHNQPSTQHHSEQLETMLQCAHCGTHFPASEALTLSSGQVFCSEDHRRQATSRV